jgi:putative RecB family exonuclease
VSEHVSFSQFTTFSRCGKQYQLERIQGVPRTPSLALLFGSAVHEAFERVLKYQVDMMAGSIQSMWGEIVESHAQRMIKEFDTDIDQFKVSGRKTEAKPNREDFDWWMIEGLQQVNAFLEWLAISGWSVYEVENQIPMVEFNASGILGGIEVKAFIDSVMVNPDGELVVVDFKTGSRTPQELQLGVYSALLEQRMGLHVDKGAYYMTRKADMSEQFDLRRYTPEFFGTVFQQFSAAKELGLYIPSVGDHCKYACDVSDACATVGGTQAYLYDPLHPAYQGGPK